MTVCIRCVLMLILMVTAFPCAGATPNHRNVLMIAVDDLRPALGCYGDETAMTPNIDQLARQGIMFRRAYCQLAVCCPSRLSLITGKRPDTIGVWDLSTHFRDKHPDAVTLPQFLKARGYHTQSIGKILHGNGAPSKDPPSWSSNPLFDVANTHQFRYVLPQNQTKSGGKRASVEIADVSDDVHIDGRVCLAAIEALEQMKRRSQPTFLAVGFRKPHLPFACPKKYWDDYQRDQIPMPEHASHPEGSPELATRSWRELEGYQDIPDDGPISDEKVLELRHGYYACVSYVDALIGRLLDKIDSLGMTEQMVVVLWGDHGFHLGEQGLWTKANNYELATRVPLIIRVPGMHRSNLATDALVELVDVYPTILDACGFQPPDDLEGKTMLTLLQQPGRSLKEAVYSQYPRARSKNRHRGHGDIMGYAVRTQRYRYVEWRQWDSGLVVARELYDHQSDPNETQNTAQRPSNRETVLRLSALLSRSATDSGIRMRSSPSLSKD